MTILSDVEVARLEFLADRAGEDVEAARQRYDNALAKWHRAMRELEDAKKAAEVRP